MTVIRAELHCLVKSAPYKLRRIVENKIERKRAMRRCFVISPIGMEGTEIREHADDVFDFIIKPAMQELEVEAYRADHINSAGKITEQMFESLLNDDLCIAILTYHNPNVFYELAVAQSAARPTVIMIEKGTVIPFDLRDLRAIEYDFKPRPIRDGVYVKHLIDHVRSIEQNDWKADVPFGRSLTPLGPNHLPLEIYDDLRSFGGDERWFEMITETKTSFAAAGISMSRWVRKQYRSLLMEKARAGCAIRILVMDVDNPSFPTMINDEDGAGNIERIQFANKGIQKAMEEMSQSNPAIEFKTIKNCSLHQQIILTDTRAVIRPHLFSRSTSELPILRIEKPSRLFDTFAAEFEMLWRRN
jgi:hypothetical protein